MVRTILAGLMVVIAIILASMLLGSALNLGPEKVYIVMALLAAASLAVVVLLRRRVARVTR